MQKQGDRFYKIIEYGSYADSSKAVATFREVSYIQTKAALSRILGMEPKEGGYTTLTSWTKERRRPSSKYLRRLCRLRLWADEGLALWDIKRINWDDLELEWNNPVKTDDPLYDPVSDNPFYMSRWTTFPFGSRRDSVHLLRDLERVHRLDTLTKGPRAAVARLLGMVPAAGGWTKVARWHRRDRYMGPKYLLRLLWLLLWAGQGYVLTDIHFVDWDSRRVEWVSGPPPGLPSNIFDIMRTGPPPKVQPARRFDTQSSTLIRSNPGGLVVVEPRKVAPPPFPTLFKPVPALNL